MITHRLGILKASDYIYVIEDGRVAEEGQFTDLFDIKTSKLRQFLIDAGENI